MDLTAVQKSRVSAIAAYFEAIFGRKLDMTSFSDRIRLQKLIYILNRAGLNLGYPFGWHIRGPYSPLLADDGYTYEENKSKVEFSHSFTEKELAIISKIKNISKFLENEENSELLASLLYLYALGYTTQDSLFSEIKTRKPRFSDEEIRTALILWGKIKNMQ